MRIPRPLAPALALAAATALLGCSSGDATSPARYAVAVQFAGMNPHVGQMLELRIVHAESMREVARSKVDPVDSASFTVTVPDVVVAGERYLVDFYADYNRNRHYDAPPADHAWRRHIGPVAGNTSVAFSHDANFTDIDWP